MIDIHLTEGGFILAAALYGAASGLAGAMTGSFLAWLKRRRERRSHYDL